MKRSCNYAVAGAALLVALAGGMTYAADAPAGYVSKEDYEKVLQRLDKVESELTTIKKDSAAAQKEHDQEMEEYAAQIKVAVEKATESHTGDTKMIIAGDFTAGFTSQRGHNSTFGAGSGAGSGVDFAPLILWEINKQLLFEGAVDFNSADGASLGLANLTYSLNDYVNVGGGLFTVPFGQYHSHFDPPWINKLPDDPLVFGSRALVPSTQVGAYVSGAVPIQSAKFVYNAYVINGPGLVTNSASNAGDLDFGSTTSGFDNNNSKMVGGRLGFLPIPELEIGYSLMCGDVGPNGKDGFDSGPTHVHAFLQAIDANYTKAIEQIGGTFSARAEWVWSHVEQATYQGPIDTNPTSPTFGTPTFGPESFNNDRSGGYLTLAYRPTMASIKALRNVEFVGRYDRIDVSNDAPSAQAAGGGHEQRCTLGIDYWLDPRVVIKTAYEFDFLNPGPAANAFMVQLGVGF